MKKYFVIFAALVAASAVSCTKNEMEGPAAVPSGFRSFQAVIGDQVKTELDETTGSVAWAEGDAIKIIWKNGGSAVSEALTAEGAAVTPVTFLAECEPDGNTYAIYPSTIDAAYTGYVEVTVPDVQTGAFEDVNILAAKYLDNKLCFQNVCGYLQFIVPEGVTKVVWTGDCINPLVGRVNVGFPDGISVNDIVDGTGKNEITINVSGAGTYYAAVVPGTFTNLYVGMYNGDTLVGDKQTFNEVTVARAQVKKMGDMPADGSQVTNKRFVTVSGAGTKDGSSWENAMDKTAFVSALKQSSSNGLNFYLAEGEYVTGEMSLNVASTSYSLYGGYPADATGVCLNGRDPELHETIFDGGGANRLFVIQQLSIVFDGITIRNALRTEANKDAGSALVFESCGDMLVNNCKILDNTNAGGNGGAIRVHTLAASVVTITNSLIEGNKTLASPDPNEKTKLGSGGAICLAKGNLVSKNNIYRFNSCSSRYQEAGGGVIMLYTDTNVAINFTSENDLFQNNRALNSTGAVIYAAAQSGGSYVIKANKSVFYKNRANNRGCIRHGTSSSKAMFNACTFAADTVASYGSTLHLNGPTAVHNCVFYANINTSSTGAANIYSSSNLLFSNSSLRLGGQSTTGIYYGGGINSIIVNSILYNTGTSSTAPNAKSTISMNASGKNFTSYGHNIIEMFSSSEDLSPIGGSYPECFVCKDASDADYLHTVTLVDGVKTWCLDPQWISSPNFVLKFTEWPAPGKPDGYELCTPARVEAAVDAFDAATSIGVKTWLNEVGGLNTDRRGTARSTTAIWPGSYDNSATAEL